MMFAHSLLLQDQASVGGVSGQIDKDSGHPGRETLSAPVLRTYNIMNDCMYMTRSWLH